MTMFAPFAFSANRRRIGVALLIAVAVPTGLVPAAAVAASERENGDRFRYVFIAQGDSSTTMNASAEDIERARAQRAGKEALLYVRDRGAAYVIRDADTLRRAAEIFRPQAIVGAQQGELGRRQGELGRRQGELGREQGRLGMLQADARPREAAELGRQQGELGRRQGELGRQQGELGRQQGLLGQEQARLAKEAEVKIKALLADAIRRGVARRIS
jgi:hypothetical protein